MLVVLAGAAAAVGAGTTALLGARAHGRRELARRTGLLVKTVTAALEATEDTAALDSAVRRLAEAVRADAGGLAVVDGDRLWLRGMWNVAPEARHRPLGRGEGIAGRVWATARPRVVTDLGAEPAYVPDSPGMRSALYLPGVSQGRVVVVLAVESRRRSAFDAGHLRLLSPVADLLAAVIDSRRQLRAAERQEERLLTSVGAELRSPLAALLGNLTTLERHGDRLGTATTGELVVAGRRAAHRMQRMLDSLALAGRLEIGEIDFLLEPLPLATVVAEAVEQVRSEIGAAAVTVGQDVATAPPPLADWRQLCTVLVELVGNAVRHGQGARVAVSAEVAGPDLLVSVRDSGPGMPATLVDTLLEGIGRPLADETGRPGLGLYLAARLSEGMHGSLTLRSRPGHGTVAVVRLPIAVG